MNKQTEEEYWATHDDPNEDGSVERSGCKWPLVLVILASAAIGISPCIWFFI